MGSYRGHSPNFLDVVRRLFRGGPPKKCQGAKMYPRTKRGDTVNYQLARTRLLGHTSVPLWKAEDHHHPNGSHQLRRISPRMRGESRPCDASRTVESRHRASIVDIPGQFSKPSSLLMS